MIKKSSELKVALVHDFIWSMRGGEKCLETFAEMCPQADIYTLFGDESKYSETLLKHKFHYSILSKLPFLKKIYRYTYFLWPLMVENYDLMDYDLVISTSPCASKGVVTGLNTVNVCYMFTPMRYAWDQTYDYFNPKNFSLWKRLVIPFFLHYLRMWDVTSTDRIDYLVTISKFVGKRIKKYYRRDYDQLIYPPVYTDMTKIAKKKEDYFYAVAPFEPNKGGRLMVECAMEHGFRLKLIGDGSMKKELEKKAKGYDNIEFLGFVNEDEKFDLISKAKGLLFVGIEEFGIVPPEAIASGVPVVAYKDGGVVETVVEGESGTFFEKRDIVNMKAAIDRLDSYYKQGRFDAQKMKKSMERFSKERFVKEFEELFDRLLSKKNS